MNRSLPRRAVAGAVIVLVALAVTATATTGTTAKSTAGTPDDPITIWLPYSAFFTPVIKASLKACEKSANVYGKVQEFPATYDELNLKIQLASTSGDAPDLALQGLNEVIPMGNGNYAVDLSPIVKGDKVFSPKVQPALFAGRINGKLLTIPWGISLPVLFVNREMFQKAGMNPDTPLTNWAQVAAAANKLNDKASGTHGISFRVQEGWVPLQFLLNTGSGLIASGGKAVFNNDAGDRAIQFQNRLYRSGVAFPGNDSQSQVAFLNGKVAILVASTGAFPALRPAKFAWSTLPFPPEKTGGSLKLAAGGVGVSMFAKPDRQAAAAKVLKCLFTPKTLRGTVLGEGYMPVRADIARVFPPGLFKKSPYAAPYAQFKYVVPWYNFPGPNGPRAGALFRDAWTRAAQTSDDPTAVMDDAADQIEKLLR